MSLWSHLGLPREPTDARARRNAVSFLRPSLCPALTCRGDGGAVSTLGAREGVADRPAVRGKLRSLSEQATRASRSQRRRRDAGRDPPPPASARGTPCESGELARWTGGWRAASEDGVWSGRSRRRRAAPRWPSHGDITHGLHDRALVGSSSSAVENRPRRARSTLPL